MKRVMSLALALSAVVGMASQAFAEIGTVDYEKLIRSYNKAQLFNDDRQIREQELEKMRAEYVKQLREAKTSKPNNPVAVEQLEKKLEGQLTTRLNETRDWMATKYKELETEMNGAIESIAKSKNLDLVLAKQTVLVGGVDITNDVLSRLNAGAPAKPAGAAAPAKK